MNNFKKSALALAAGAVLLSGCLSSNNTALPPGDVFALTADNNLVSFNRTSPTQIRTLAAISGLMAGDTLVGMDFRPRDRNLYAVARTQGNGGRLYTINTSTGVATMVANLVAHPADTSAPFSTLDPAATSFGVDFNPAADALRVISNTGQNLRIFVQTVAGQTPDRQAGFTFTDGNLARSDSSATPFADTGTAYTNSFDGTTSTRMFNIDTTNGNLIQQTDPNGGVTRIAAPLFGSRTTISASNGFDIDASNNLGYALLTVGNAQTFYSINIPDATATLPATAPAATALGNVNINGVIGLALAPEAAPTVVGLDGTTAGAQRLLKFGLRTPNDAAPVAITGLPAGEALVSIDFRPSNGRLYGLSNQGKIFTINPDTGAATLGSTLSVAADIVAGLTAGKVYNIDFNPAADALRIVSNGAGDGVSKNYRIPGANLETSGTTVTDTDLTLGNVGTGFNVVNIAYTNSFANPAPTATRMFNLDIDNSRLLQQVPPNNGTQNVIGPFGSTPTALGGIDVSGGDNGMRLVAARTGATGPFSLFNIDLASGALSAAASANGTNAIGSGGSEAANLVDISVKF